MQGQMWSLSRRRLSMWRNCNEQSRTWNGHSPAADRRPSHAGMLRMHNSSNELLLLCLRDELGWNVG